MNVYPNESVLDLHVFAAGVTSLVYMLLRYPLDATLWLRVSNWPGSSLQLEVSSLVYMLLRYPSDHTLWVRVPNWSASSLQLGFHLWCICFCAIPQITRYDCVFPTDLLHRGSWKFHLWCICFSAIPQITRYEYVFPAELLRLCGWVSLLVYMLWRYPSDHALWVRVPNRSASSLQLGFH